MMVDYKRTKEFLSTFYPNEPVFEISSETLRALDSYQKHYEQMDDQAHLTLELLKTQTQEYKAEGGRIEAELTALGVSNLNQKGREDQEDVCTLAVELDLKAPTITNFYLSMSKLTRDIFKSSSECKTRQKDLDELLTKFDVLLRRVQGFTKDAAHLNALMRDKDGKLQAKKNRSEFFNIKCEEYKNSIIQIQKKLGRCSLEPSIYHSSLASEHAEVKEIQLQRNELMSSLKNYLGLPMSEEDLEVDIRELQFKIKELDDQLFTPYQGVFSR